jgi:hypothetical protein
VWFYLRAPELSAEFERVMAGDRNEITKVDRRELQASEEVQRLADDLGHLVSARGMLVVERVL